MTDNTFKEIKELVGTFVEDFLILDKKISKIDNEEATIALMIQIILDYCIASRKWRASPIIFILEKLKITFLSRTVGGIFGGNGNAYDIGAVYED